MLRGRELTRKWSRACRMLGSVAGAARIVSMPLLVRENGHPTKLAGLLAAPLENIGSSMVTSFA